jgi:uncharacterized protein YgiM (DUF1202 family)
MGFKKIVALAVITTSISGVAFNTTANAEEITNNDISNVVESNINPKIAGMFTVTAKSGANIRSGAGTNYSIVATARYGADLTYCGEKKVVSGVTWYKVLNESETVKGWISGTTGFLS